MSKQKTGIARKAIIGTLIATGGVVGGVGIERATAPEAELSTCMSDLNGDGSVNFADLQLVRASMFRADCPTGTAGQIFVGSIGVWSDPNSGNDDAPTMQLRIGSSVEHESPKPDPDSIKAHNEESHDLDVWSDPREEKD